MNSHNTKPYPAASGKAVRIEADRNDVRVLRSRLCDADELAIDDDYDNGGDPYNNTGQHVALKVKHLVEK
jgi:hypothetical protein